MKLKLKHSGVSIDILASVFGICLGIITLFLWLYLHGALLAWAAFVLLSSCCVYLIAQRVYSIRDRDTIFMLMDDLPDLTNRVIIIMMIIIVALAIITIMTVWTSIYYRNITYLIGLICISLLIVASILLPSKEQKKSILVILLEIMLLGVIIRASVFYTTPGLVGVDPWFHAQGIELIRLNGKIAPELEWYSSFPIFHLIVTELSVLSGLNVKDAMFIAVGMFETISVILIFLLGRHYFSQRLGLLAAYLLTISNYHIRWGFWIIPMSLGVAFLPYFIYAIARFHDSPKRRDVLLYILSLTIILTHHLSSVVVFTVVISLYLATRLDAKRIGLPDITEKRFPALYTMAYGISIWAHWIFCAYLFFETFVAKAISSLLSIDIYMLPETVIESAVHRQNLAIFFSFSILGSIHILRKDAWNSERGNYVIAAWTLAILTFMAQITGRSTILPQRWLTFVMIVMALPAALGINFICTTFAKLTSHTNLSVPMKNLRCLMFVVMVMLLSVLMITDPQASADGSFGHARLSVTASELQSVNLLSKLSTDTISTDWYMLLPLRYRYGYTDLLDATAMFTQGNVSDTRPGILIVRNYVLASPAEGGHPVFVRNLIDFHTPRYNLIYNCGTVAGYYLPPS